MIYWRSSKYADKSKFAKVISNNKRLHRSTFLHLELWRGCQWKNILYETPIYPAATNITACLATQLLCRHIRLHRHRWWSIIFTVDNYLYGCDGQLCFRQSDSILGKSYIWYELLCCHRLILCSAPCNICVKKIQVIARSEIYQLSITWFPVNARFCTKMTMTKNETGGGEAVVS